MFGQYKNAYAAGFEGFPAYQNSPCHSSCAPVLFPGNTEARTKVGLTHCLAQSNSLIQEFENLKKDKAFISCLPPGSVFLPIL